MTYDYKLPEGYILKPELKARLDELAEFHHMDDSEIQAFVDIHIELMQEYNVAMCRAMIQVANANLPAKSAAYHKEGSLEIDHTQLSKNRSSKGGRNKNLRYN